MPSIKNTYPSSSDLTCTLGNGTTGLASDTNLLTGRQSSEVDNTTTRHLDFLCSGQVTTGTSPTGGSIEVWAVAAFDTLGTKYPDVITGAGDAGKTWTSAAIKSGAARLVYAVGPSTTSNVAYPWSGISLAGVFGGTLPPRFVLFVVHSTGVALNATAGNHILRVQPVLRDVS